MRKNHKKLIVFQVKNKEGYKETHITDDNIFQTSLEKIKQLIQKHYGELIFVFVDPKVYWYNPIHFTQTTKEVKK